MLLAKSIAVEYMMWNNAIPSPFIILSYDHNALLMLRLINALGWNDEWMHFQVHRIERFDKFSATMVHITILSRIGWIHFWIFRVYVRHRLYFVIVEFSNQMNTFVNRIANTQRNEILQTPIAFAFCLLSVYLCDTMPLPMFGHTHTVDGRILYAYSSVK